MWRRLSPRRICLGIILITAVAILYAAFKASSIIIPKACTDDQTTRIFDNLCNLYQSQAVGGNLCEVICTSKSIIYEDCLFKGKGKKVIAATYNSKKIILKSRNERLEEFELLFSANDKGGFAPPEMDYDSFKSMFKSHMEALMGMKLVDSEDVLLSKMWTSPILQNDELTPGEMNSVWTLVQQSEFNYLKYFHGAQFLPDIYGSCGHFYAVEYIPSGKILDPSLLSLSEQWDSAPWPNRAKIGLSLMDLIASTETFYSEILHLCDVKPDNFGVTEDFQVKAIDIDISFFTPQMRDYLQQPDCTADEECDFFDCHGACNKSTQKCLDVRTNNNFQSVCSDILMHHHTYPGLLRNPPAEVATEITELLDKCVNPSREEKYIQTPSITKTFQRLHSLLKESLQIR
ncbi:divergent protein kinase domain 1C-like [Amphiura filiformis]|uniref:divergent protein kinase domain 1C-like n=1 Tax=Amphiura filiformis TaxID=82378 RepID=UPI003B21F896